MGNSVKVSVVMSVYNDARYLRESIESILSQKGVNFEFIIVNDGSTDESPAILEEYAKKDNRIQLIHQENQGLTMALIRGCNEAQGKYIARQDSDDISFPGRLQRLTKELDAHHQVIMVSPSTVLIGPRNELLINNSNNGSLPTRSMHYHGSLMFRRDTYKLVGGYHKEFHAAQDVDLRFRLEEVGEIRYIPDLLYAWRVDEDSISAQSPIQKKIARLAWAARDARRDGKDELEILREAANISSDPFFRKRSEPGTGNYFIGRCLYSQGDRRALFYLWNSCINNLLSFRSWLSLALAFFKTRSNKGYDIGLSGISRNQS